MDLSAVTVVLPALDEAEALPTALASFPSGVDLLVVDNGSRDGTAAVAAAAGARVVVEPRRGFGAACWAGVQASPHAEVIAFADADGSFDGADLTAVAGPVLHDQADLVVGSRITGVRDNGAMPPFAVAVNRSLGLACRLLFGVCLTDLGPFRAIRRDTLVALGIRDRGQGWPLEMIGRAGRAGLRVVEVPVRYRPRAGGTSKVSGSLRGGLRAAAAMGTVTCRLLVDRPPGAAQLAPASRPAMRDAVAVIAKEPVAGMAKTRLAPTLGEAGAARVAAAMLADTLAVVGTVGADPWLCFTPAEARERLRRLAPGFGLLAQGNGDLGDRLAACLADLLAAGAERVAIVGADTPHLPAAGYWRALALLEQADVVLGPALDGGYYLVAAKRSRPELFVGIPMGTEAVLAETLARAAHGGLVVALLPPLRDLDRVEDLAAALAAGDLAGAPATLAAVTELLAGREVGTA
jgi:rSAM/selenodomain-associated transferase 1